MEDAILTRNVPGRWSQHDDEMEKPRFEIEGKDAYYSSINDRSPSFCRISNENKIPLKTLKSKTQNTGIKGVLADYEHSKESNLRLQHETKLERYTVIQRLLIGTSQNSQNLQHCVDGRDCVDSDDDKTDSDDEYFINQYRELRIKDMKSSCVLAARKTFGHVIDIDSDQFLIETDCKGITTIVHLFDPSVQSCTRMNNSLEKVASQFTTIKFLRYNARENGIPIDRVALPILSIYRDGEVVTVLAGLQEELGNKFTAEDVSWLLETTLQNL